MLSIIHLTGILAITIFFSLSFKIKPIADTSIAGENLPTYTLVKNWPQLSKNYSLNEPSGIGIDTSQNIFVFNRTGRNWTEPFPDTLISVNTILMLDRETGKILNSWGANLFIMPHGLTVDKNNNVWVTDVSLQEVFKFSHDGKLLMKLGLTRETGSDSLRFNRPTDVAVADDGSFYVSDGYLNSRIVKFSSEGKYLFEWGTKGDKPGQFNIPHAIDLDAKGNVYVADRENERVQVFDADGKFLKEYKNKKFEKLYSVTIDQSNQNLLAVDYLSVMNLFPKGSNIIQFDLAGNLLQEFGRTGAYDGPVTRYHDIAVDNEGSLYVADLLGNTVQKFIRITQ